MAYLKTLLTLIQTAIVGSELRETVVRHRTAADRLDAALKEVLKR